MVADIININGLFLAIFGTGENTTDIGLAYGARTEGSRIRQQRFKELNRNNLLAFIVNRLGRQHANVLQALHMCQIALTEGHEEANAFYAGDILSQRFNFLMVQQIHILHANLREIILAFNSHRRDFYPMTVFPIRTGSRNLTQVNFRVEVGSERITVVAAVAVQNINSFDFIKIMLQCVSGEYTGNTGVKASAEQSHDAGLLKFFFISPLPGIIEVSREALFLAALVINCTPCGIVNVFRLIVSGIDVINLAFQAGIHNSQVLIRQSNIQHCIRLVSLNQLHKLFLAVSVNLCCSNHSRGRGLQLFFNCVTFGLRTAGNTQLGENITVLTAFCDSYAGNTAAADY